MGLVEGKPDFSSAFWHMAQNTPLGAFVPRPLLELILDLFALGNLMIGTLKDRRFHAQLRLNEGRQ
jgi:hypothetical protein